MPRLSDTVSAMTDFKRNGAAGTIDLPLESILDGISDAISLLDKEWRYTYVNSQAETLSGLKKEQLLGRSIWEIFPAAIGSEFEAQSKRAVAEQRQINFEYHSPTFGRWSSSGFIRLLKACCSSPPTSTAESA